MLTLCNGLVLTRHLVVDAVSNLHAKAVIGKELSANLSALTHSILQALPNPRLILYLILAYPLPYSCLLYAYPFLFVPRLPSLFGYTHPSHKKGDT